MIKELSTAIMEISKTRNKYLKWLSRENYVSKGKCNPLAKKAKKAKNFLKEATKLLKETPQKRNLHNTEIT